MLRQNSRLDMFMAETPSGDVNSLKLPKPKRRPRKPGAMTRDRAKRYAFRVLAILANLDAKERGRVLTIAAKLSKS
jgi:hypothetical protein